MKNFRYGEAWRSFGRFFVRKTKMRLWLYKNALMHLGTPEIRTKYLQKAQRIRKSNRSGQYPQAFAQEGPCRVAVYTCIFGNYDTVKPIGCRSKYCDYYIITDQIVDETSGWKKYEVEFPQELKDASPAMKNRYCKMHPHILFPEYTYSIYMDGSVMIRADIFPLLGRMGEKMIGMYAHSSRNCIYAEAAKVVELGKAPADIVELQMQKYRQEGFPEKFGLTDGIVIVRKHNAPQCIQLMQDWWELFCQYSKRDQLGLMYALWKNGLQYTDMALLGANYLEDARLDSAGHN